jgi:hypothetical protein
MTIYEVTARVGDHLSGEFERYMIEQHIPDVLATGAFLGATLDLADDGFYRVSYVARSEEELDTYLNEHSPALRKDLAGRFPDGIELSRKRWTTIRTWKS